MSLSSKARLERGGLSIDRVYEGGAGDGPAFAGGTAGGGAAGITAGPVDGRRTRTRIPRITCWAGWSRDVFGQAEPRTGDPRVGRRLADRNAGRPRFSAGGRIGRFAVQQTEPRELPACSSRYLRVWVRPSRDGPRAAALGSRRAGRRRASRPAARRS